MPRTTPLTAPALGLRLARATIVQRRSWPNRVSVRDRAVSACLYYSWALSCQDQAEDPGAERERRTDQHHRPTRCVNRSQLETEARIPNQVPNASAEVQEER